jgi:tetratricopeptide (TPR) repeat protein
MHPRDPVILDQYEMLIEQTLLAGRIQEAFDLYWHGLGGYTNLGAVLGENGRGLRTLERFVPQDDFSCIERRLPPHDRGLLVNAFGLFANSLGDLARARKALRHSRELARRASDRKEESRLAQNLAGLGLNAGRFRQALAYSNSAVSLATEAQDKDEIKTSLAYQATSHFALGDITVAEADFRRATELEGEPLSSLGGIWEAECKILQGNRTAALSQTRANREGFAIPYNNSNDLCRCNALLVRLILPDDPAQAGQHLQDARAFAGRSGVVEHQLRCFHAACERHLHLGDYTQAIAEAKAGVLLADTCGFGKYSIELRLALAETLLAAGDARKALQNAREALDRSEQPDCAYAWGRADGLHFCGLAHLRLGERELARQRLTAALELRERLGHGRIEETRRALDLCRP